MLRIVMACAILFALTAAPALAQNPSGQPLRIGDWWIYSKILDVKGGQKHSSFARFSTPFTVNGGEFLFTLLGGDTKEMLDRNIERRGPARFHGKNINPDLCVIDPFDAVSLTNRPCSAPLAVGDAWSVEREVSNGREKSEYNVIGLGKITVPAGTFKALKVKNNRRYQDRFDELIQSLTNKKAELQKKDNLANSNQQRITYWYAPEVKCFVKRYIEYLNDSGVIIFTETDELIEFNSQK